MSSTSCNQFFTGVISSDEQLDYSLIQESWATSFGRPLLEYSRRNGSKWIVAAPDVSIRSKIFPPSQVRMYALKHCILFFFQAHFFPGTCFTISSHWKTGCRQKFGQNILLRRFLGRSCRTCTTTQGCWSPTQVWLQSLAYNWRWKLSEFRCVCGFLD